MTRGTLTLVEETQLIERAQAGDAAAFGELVRRHSPRAIAAARRLVGCAEDARDLSQEAFVRAYRARAAIDPQRPFFPWLYQILRRLCFNHGRDRALGRQREAEAAEARRAASVDPAEATARTEGSRRMQRAIDQLSDRHRELIVLKHLENLRYREIAELLGIPLGTVMSRLSAARRTLTRLLEQPEEELDR